MMCYLSTAVSFLFLVDILLCLCIHIHSLIGRAGIVLFHVVIQATRAEPLIFSYDGVWHLILVNTERWCCLLLWGLVGDRVSVDFGCHVQPRVASIQKLIGGRSKVHLFFEILGLRISVKLEFEHQEGIWTSLQQFIGCRILFDIHLLAQPLTQRSYILTLGRHIGYRLYPVALTKKLVLVPIQNLQASPTWYVNSE